MLLAVCSDTACWLAPSGVDWDGDPGLGHGSLGSTGLGCHRGATCRHRGHGCGVLGMKGTTVPPENKRASLVPAVGCRMTGAMSLGCMVLHGDAEAPHRWWCLEVDEGGSLARGSPGVPQCTKAMDSAVR